jgi:hypothetical protein
MRCSAVQCSAVIKLGQERVSGAPSDIGDIRDRMEDLERDVSKRVVEVGTGSQVIDFVSAMLIREQRKSIGKCE